MAVTGVQGGEQDLGHAVIIADAGYHRTQPLQ
jgi:hypothetical protein